MEKVIDLKDLLKHEIMDLYSAEEQIIEALPLMIEKAGDAKLKAALKEHLKVTENQKSRLDEIKQMFSAEEGEEEGAPESSTPGFFSRLFGGGSEKCKGMEGLISEGKKMMSTDMSPQASDAAIIASAQKIEHYEICGYGTARAFARELNLGEIASKLEQTLNEEYTADDLLTELAVGKINIEAEFASESDNGSPSGKSAKSGSAAKSNSRGTGAKSGTSSSNGKSSSGKSNSSKTPVKSAVKTSASKGGSSSAQGKGSSSKGGGKSFSPTKKSAVKSSASKVVSSSAQGKGSSSKSASKSKSPAKKSAAKSSKSPAKKSSSKRK